MTHLMNILVTAGGSKKQSANKLFMQHLLPNGIAARSLQVLASAPGEALITIVEDRSIQCLTACSYDNFRRERSQSTPLI